MTEKWQQCLIFHIMDYKVRKWKSKDKIRDYFKKITTGKKYFMHKTAYLLLFIMLFTLHASIHIPASSSPTLLIANIQHWLRWRENKLIW